MALSASLIHEVDLLRVFDFMDRNAAGIYSAEACRISRMSTSVDPTIMRPNILARCDINWFTIRLADGKDITI